MPPRPSPRIHLPPLDAAYALTLVDILEQVIDQIWRAHGHRMADLVARAAARRRRCSHFVDDGNPDAPDDAAF